MSTLIFSINIFVRCAILHTTVTQIGKLALAAFVRRVEGQAEISAIVGASPAPINPSLHVYYMVTGRNVRCELINDGQQITREEAVWLYTAANGWFSREEDTLGSIEAGRFADLVVLNADVFDRAAVPDEAIRRVHSVLTIVGGNIVHGDRNGLE